MMPASPQKQLPLFKYDAEGMYIERSGKHFYRAPLKELRLLVKNGANKQHTAAWCSAQLELYGMRPSSNKSVALVRLQNASRDGQLKVPPSLVAMEKDLKAQYTRTSHSTKRAHDEHIGDDSMRQRQSKKLKTLATKSALITSSFKTTKRDTTNLAADRVRTPQNKALSRSTIPTSTFPATQHNAESAAEHLRLPHTLGGESEAQDVESQHTRREAPGTVVRNGPRPIICRYDLTTVNKGLEWEDTGRVGYTLHLLTHHNTNECYGRFDLGILSGILKLDRNNTSGRHYFHWVGREAGGCVLNGKNKGWIRFKGKIGSGFKEGHFEYRGIEFAGKPVKNAALNDDQEEVEKMQRELVEMSAATD